MNLQKKKKYVSSIDYEKLFSIHRTFFTELLYVSNGESKYLNKHLNKRIMQLKNYFQQLPNTR